MSGLIVRIALRYLAGVLVARGLFGADDAQAIVADPDLAVWLEAGVGFGIGVIAEGWHYLARRFGWEH